jgi:hypothetical protein
MRIYFNLVGALLFLVALYFGYWWVQAGGVVRSAISQPNGELAVGFAVNIANGYAQIALLGLIGSGIFTGVAEIMAAIERSANRSETSEGEEGLLS